MTDTLPQPPSPLAEANAPAGPLWLTGGGTRQHGAVAYRRLLRTLCPEPGVVGVNDLRVTAQTTPAMAVNVAAGEAVIAGDEAAGQGSYHVHSDGVVILPVAPAHAQYDRYDGIFAVIVDKEYSLSPSPEGWRISIVKGPEQAHSGEPEWPSDPPSSIWLASIFVPVGKTSIVAADITDWRSGPIAVPGARGTSDEPVVGTSARTDSGLLVQGGSTVVITNGAGGCSIAYPVPFTAGVFGVSAMPGDPYPVFLLTCIQGNMTLSALELMVFQVNGSAWGGLTCRINWIAFGY